MPQFSGHWYSGRAARLVFVEAALVAIALSISGQSAHGWRELAALMAVAACVPAALYLADLYDPQIMRNDRSRGASVLKALGFAALAAAIVGLICGGTAPRGGTHRRTTGSHRSIDQQCRHRAVRAGIVDQYVDLRNVRVR